MSFQTQGLKWSEAGQVWLGPDLTALRNRLDGLLVKIADKYQAQAFTAPSFIEVDTLRKMDYLHSFPQHATFPVTLEDSDANLQAFREQIFDSQGSLSLSDCSQVNELLTPAACYHLYPLLQGEKLKQHQCWTTVCTCYRREKDYTPLERQWNFTMREIICVGSLGDTQSFLEQVREDIESLIGALDIPLSWETATDPFFDPSNNPKFLLQKLQPNKQELVFDNRLAIASQNLHRNYFGETFDIKLGDNYAFTACTAFGLERWLAAIIETYGADKSAWPDVLV